MLRNSLTLLFVLFTFALRAETMTFAIRYLGLKVADVTMTDTRNGNTGLLTVHAVSTPFASHLVQMDNTYTSTYQGDYLTLTYKKRIIQKDYEEDRTTTYNRTANQAERVSRIAAQRNRSYAVRPLARDFFCSLFHSRRHLKDPLLLDAAGAMWSADCREMEKETLRTVLGRVPTIKVQYTFTAADGAKRERSDILTNNLVSRGDPLYFWFTNDERRIPVRASFRMSPFPVSWELESYTP